MAIYILVILLGFASSSFAQTDDDPISKSYRIINKTVAQFEPLVQTLLSNRGIVTMSEDMNMMIVVDKPPYISRVDSLVHYFDVPSKQLVLNFRVVAASKENFGEADENGVEVDSLALELGAIISPTYDFDTFELLDKVYLRVEEKLTADLTMANGKYNVSFYVDHIPSRQPKVRFRNLVLNEVKIGIAGKESVPIYTTSAEIYENTEEIFAAFRDEKTGKTLILLVSASSIN